METLFACASATFKSINQDFCSSFKNEKIGLNGIIVADGIGSHFKAELASKFCTETLRGLLESIDKLSNSEITSLFKETKLSLLNFCENNEEFSFSEINKKESLSTTLICALELQDEFVFGYCGNGSIWHLSGYFNSFGPNRYLPWNAINLLNPHTIEQEGKEALYRYFSITDVECTPSIIRIAKNALLPGDIILVATDGIFSNDHVQVGKDDQNIIWIKSEESMPLLFKRISDFLSNNPQDADNDDLKFALYQYLDELKASNYMHDDSTVGVFITERAIDYHQQLYNSTFKKAKK